MHRSMFRQRVRNADADRSRAYAQSQRCSAGKSSGALLVRANWLTTTHHAVAAYHVNGHTQPPYKFMCLDDYDVNLKVAQSAD